MGRPGTFVSYCRYCGDLVADKYLAKHLEHCPKNPNKKN